MKDYQCWKQGHDRNSDDSDESDSEEVADYSAYEERYSEKGGKPVDQVFVDKVLAPNWGNEKVLAKDYKESLKEIKIPDNCKFLKQPRLNHAVYKKLVKTKMWAIKQDKTTTRRLMHTTKAAIPIIKSITKLQKCSSRKGMDKKECEKMADMLHDSLLTLNMLVTDGTRQRRFDALAPLGEDIKSHATLTKGLLADREVLFDEPTMSEIKKELKEADKSKTPHQSTSRPPFGGHRQSSSHSNPKNWHTPRYNPYSGGNKFNNQESQKKKFNNNNQGNYNKKH